MESDNRKLQLMTLDLLKVFMEICEKNNFRYYLTGGALIGVFRHGGFIPWDDDIDICMPRKDFDKFHEYINKNMPCGYGICDRFHDLNWHFALSQFMDLETSIEIDLAKEKRKSHVWIDIFPIDGVPANNLKKWLRVKNVLFHRYLVQIANINTQVDAHKERPFYEKFILKVCSIIRIDKLINSNAVIDHMEKVLRKSDFDTAVYAGNLLGRYREKEVILRKYYGQPHKEMFDGVMVCCPEDSHGFLTSIYGDYMKLPPVEKRVAHNVKILKSR